MSALKIIFLFTKRKLVATKRNSALLFMVMLTPVLYLLLFSPLLKNLPFPNDLSEGNMINMFVPGMLTLVAYNGGSWLGYGIIDELRSGVIERFKVTPIKRSTFLLGTILGDAIVNLFEILSFSLVALLFGFQPNWPGLLLALPLYSLVLVTAASFSYAIGLITKSEDLLSPIVHGIHLPLMLLSGMMLPMRLAPGWLKMLAKCNPLYYVVEGSKSLINGHFHDHGIWMAYGIMLPVTLLCLWWSKKAFEKALYP